MMIILVPILIFSGCHAQCNSQGIDGLKECYGNLFKSFKIDISFSKNIGEIMQNLYEFNEPAFCEVFNEKTMCLKEFEKNCINAAAFKKAFEISADESLNLLGWEYHYQSMCNIKDFPKSEGKVDANVIINKCSNVGDESTGCEYQSMVLKCMEEALRQQCNDKAAVEFVMKEMRDIQPDYLKQYGYMNVPLCPSIKDKNSFVCALKNPKTSEITEEEALKMFQQNSELPKTGLFDDATLQKMDESRCGNTDLQNPVKINSVPWKQRKIYYGFLNFTNKLEVTEIRRNIQQAFGMWETIIPRRFIETNDTTKADIKILFTKGEHGCEGPFDDKPGGVLAHGYTNGLLHFDDDEIWRTYSDDWENFSDNTESEFEQTDFLYCAIHEIGHVLGLIHSHGSVESIMNPFKRNPVRKDDGAGLYLMPSPLVNDVKNLQQLYGGKSSKASKNGFISELECSEYCFI